MKMFHWTNTEFNEQYTGGDIIVIAETVFEAREKALKEFKRELERYSPMNERDKKKLKIFRKDIAEEPKTKSVIFIAGSA